MQIEKNHIRLFIKNIKNPFGFSHIIDKYRCFVMELFDLQYGYFLQIY
jgi:hypothetical protein